MGIKHSKNMCTMSWSDKTVRIGYILGRGTFSEISYTQKFLFYIASLEKKVGNWSTDGVCNPLFEDDSCGPGYQVQRRTCSDGAREQCSFEDTERVVSCNEHDCPREITEWENIGSCQGIGEDKTCGDGIQHQTRNCKDGTTNKCLDIEVRRTLSCNETGNELPKCKGNEMNKYLHNIIIKNVLF